MGYLTNYWVVSLLYCCNGIYLSNEHHLFKNDPDWCSRWWDMADWQWKVGFTPRAIRHVHPCLWIWSSGVMSSYLWVLSLEFANMVAHTQFTFLKYPCLGPSSTPSANIHKNQNVLTLASASWYTMNAMPLMRRPDPVLLPSLNIGSVGSRTCLRGQY